MDRREAIASMGAGAAAAYGVGSPSWERFRRLASSLRQSSRFFSDTEFATLRVLVDLIIPRDAKSGSATDSGALPYMDFVVGDSGPRTQVAWRSGLAWFDDESMRRFNKPFVQGTDANRTEILELVAWPARAAAELRPQVDFFNRLRDLTASAFFSSRMGVEDLGYLGGVFNPTWQGAPDAALRELDVSYAEWDTKYGARSSDARRTTHGLPAHDARPSDAHPTRHPPTSVTPRTRNDE